MKRGGAFGAFFLSSLIAGLAMASPVDARLGDALRARLAEAGEGATVVVEAGDYAGPLAISKAVRLVGRPGATLWGDEKTHVVTITAADVEISGFTIRGSGRDLGKDQAAIHTTGARTFIHGNRITDSLHGIYVRRANDCTIVNNIILGDGAVAEAVADPLSGGLKPGESELCDVESPQDRRGNGIHLWNSAGHVITGNTIMGTRDGIYFSFTDGTTVRDNTITKVRYGLHYMYSDENTFEGNLFSENAAGSALMYSKGIVLRGNRFVANRSHRAYGILFQSVDDTRVEENLIEGNTLGFYLENSNNVTVRGNRVVGNYIGLRVSDSTAGGRFHENVFFGNIHPVETSGANQANAWTVDGRGNYWEGALTLDLNRDGIADLPHREPDLFGGWRRSFPAVGLLSASPGEKLLRLIHSRIALPSLPGVTDTRPLITTRKTP
ncbi:carbohydrate-binding protein [Nibricoccus aquaticus]|uniref:Carbohydrate-binding protein n=1 Tax=Nibricoccus aquaticus TaxID=2576891 RepID=A0A290Q7K4_9BACT|nr:NosD domain-containing protein [Nibricoccus aquaticus]ATC63150.1 carbohydrate-binding protein [Nibricoccus aquaticus]